MSDRDDLSSGGIATTEARQEIEGLAAVLVLHSGRMLAQVFRRGASDAWDEITAITAGDELVELTSIGFSTPLAAFYGRPPDVLERVGAASWQHHRGQAAQWDRGALPSGWVSPTSVLV
jgi:hypothetical protein